MDYLEIKTFEIIFTGITCTKQRFRGKKTFGKTLIEIKIPKKLVFNIFT